MAGFDVTESLKKVFLIGVGAVATGIEKSQELIDDLVKKGELTVEQGKELNVELTRKVKETADEGQDAVLRARLKFMTPEEREEWVKRASKIASDLDAEAVEVEVEEVVEEVVEDAEAVVDAEETEEA